MTQRRIWDGVDTVVIDLDGVVYIGNEGISGVGEALDALASAGLDLMFVTNSSTKTQAETAAKIERTTGYPASPEAVVTSAIVTASRLAGTVDTALVVGSAAIVSALEDRGIAVIGNWEQADAVVVGLDRDISYEKLTAAAKAIRGGAVFYATNTDATFPTPEGLVPGGGAIVAAVSTASGTQPVVSGKPHQSMIDHIAAAARGTILVVGDRADTDIAMARRGGWRSALVMTGVVDSLAEIAPDQAPQIVAASLPELVALRD